jgi:hypothetical protein
LSVPIDSGTNVGKKVSSLLGGMFAGADSIDDMAVLRHGGMKRDQRTDCPSPPPVWLALSRDPLQQWRAKDQRPFLHAVAEHDGRLSLR